MMMIYVIVIIIIIVIPGSSVAMDLQHSTKQNPFLRAYSTIKNAPKSLFQIYHLQQNGAAIHARIESGKHSFVHWPMNPLFKLYQKCNSIKCIFRNCICSLNTSLSLEHIKVSMREIFIIIFFILLMTFCSLTDCVQSLVTSLCGNLVMEVIYHLH